MERRERHRTQLVELRAVCAHGLELAPCSSAVSACTYGCSTSRSGTACERARAQAASTSAPTVRRHPRRPAAGQAVGKVGIQTYACTLRAEAQRRIAHEHVIDVRTEHGRRIEDIHGPPTARAMRSTTRSTDAGSSLYCLEHIQLIGLRPATPSAASSSRSRSRARAAESVAPVLIHQPSGQPLGGAPANTFTTTTGPGALRTYKHDRTASSKCGDSALPRPPRPSSSFFTA